ncbi:hypothetical protein [Acinetobacter radioresistens]|uniref:hypothetical protein n=1 Tax=Acinetobacter radioresistens TaxID=40216 RepID=UPI000DAD679C|nr:hypothetical protein [Acinetobacter radioresistens]AWV87074.1 hypothetical protein DOM24_10915 [Acinetobacter radioresistens]MCX0328949.1 hypothetical protein [Acinetobacter radioresistens]
MRSVEDMAFELIAREVSRVGVLSVDPEKINEAWGIAKYFQQRANEANQGVPTAILEAERRKCEHCWVDATVDGSVRDCIKCGQRREEG